MDGTWQKKEVWRARGPLWHLQRSVWPPPSQRPGKRGQRHGRPPGALGPRGATRPQVCSSRGLRQRPGALTPWGGKQAWARGNSQMDSSQFASDSWGAEPGHSSRPSPPSRPGGVRLQLLGFLCHHAHREVPPASSSTGADPQDLAQVGFVLPPGPLRYLTSISPFLHSPCVLKTPTGQAWGVLDRGTFCWKTACVSPADSSRCSG